MPVEPLTYEQRTRLYDRVQRDAKMATTYLRKAEEDLYVGAEYGLRPIPTQYWTLLDQALTTAFEIVENLPDDWFESTPMEDFFGLRAALDPEGLLDLPGKHNMSDGPLEEAEKLVTLITEKRGQADLRRKLALLENHTGRTPEEAAAFQAKADQLREGSNG